MNEFRKRPLFWAALALAAGVFMAGKAGWLDRLPEDHVVRFAPADDALLRGVVASEPEERKSYGERFVSFTLEAERILAGGEAFPVKGRVRASVLEPDAVAYGDRVVLRGDLERPRGRRNPGGWDAGAYLSTRRVYAVFYGGKDGLRVESRGRGFPPRAWAIRAKRFFCAKLDAGFSKADAALLSALFFGERTGLGDETKELFLRTGTLHILAVSGFNVGFLAAAVLFVFGLLPVPRNAALLAALASVWGYCLLVGWQAPVLRATIMATLVLLAKLWGRRADTLNLLGFAALAILLWEPRQLFDVGFQLSFLAVAGLSAFPKRWSEKGEKKRGFLAAARELFDASFAATAATLPVTLRVFHLFPPLSLLANMAVVPLFAALFYAGVAYLLLPAGVPLLPQSIHGLIALSIAALRAVEALPAACLSYADPGLAAALLLAGGILWLSFGPWLRAGRLRMLAVALWVTAFMLGLEAARFAPRPFTATFLDVGQGDAAFFEFPDGTNLLVDAGRGGEADSGRRVLVPFLRSRGVRTVDLAVATHPQADHIGGFPAVFRECRVRNVLAGGTRYETASWNAFLKAAERERAPILVARTGGDIRGLGAELRILHPSRADGKGDVNEESVILWGRSGEATFLLTGDAGEEALGEVVAAGVPRAKLLKVPHHGAKPGPAEKEFTRRAAPDFSVISCGRNNRYGHPRPEAIAMLEAVPGNRIWRTDRSGAAVFRGERLENSNAGDFS